MTTLNGIEFAYKPSIIFAANETWRFGREPVLRRMPDGSLVCLVYSGGPREPDDDNCCLITRSADDGATWSPPELLFDHPARAVWGTEIFTEGPRPFAVLHTFDTASTYTEIQAFLSFTDDAGRTWSEPVSIPGGGKSVVVRQGIVLCDGAWLFPCYWQDVLGGWRWEKVDGHHRPGKARRVFRSGVLRSTDKGRVFSLHGCLSAERNLWEPNAVEIAPGRLVMYMRASGAGYLYRSDSADDGLTWTPAAPTDIPNADTKVTLVKVGDAVAMLNNPNPKCGFGERNPLSLWVSRDGCRTWPTRLDLARIPPHEQHKVPAGQPDCWPKAICYPHAFADAARKTLYVACDAVTHHYFLKVPFTDFLSA